MSLLVQKRISHQALSATRSNFKPNTTTTVIRLTHWSVSPTLRLFECLLLTNKVQINALNKDLLNICSISNTFRFLLLVTCILLLQPLSDPMLVFANIFFPPNVICILLEALSHDLVHKRTSRVRLSEC